MKFRLANSTNAGAQSLSNGIGSAIQAYMMGDQIKQQAADEAMDAQAKRDLVGAQSRSALAQAGKYDAEAGQIGDQRTRASFPELVKAAAFQFGVPTDATPDLEHVLNTGTLPSQYQPPIDGRGPVMPAPDFLAPENLARIRQMVGGTNQALAVGDKSVKSIADAAEVYRNMGLEDRALTGQVSPLVLAQTKYAMSGKAPFDFNEYGTGNNLTGTMDASNPAAQRFGLLRQSEIGENNAQAGKYRAEADKARRDPVSGGSAPSGYRWTPSGNLEAIPGGPSANKTGAVDAKTADANDVLYALQEASNIIDGSTGSYLGAAFDEGARAFGMSTPGAQVAAKLKTIQGMLISKMPKMSGPQSDKDVMLYREMAGQIGDPTIPIETRKAAIETIKMLNERYAGITPNTPPSAPGGASASWDAPAGAKVATEADIQETMRNSRRSREEVIKALKAKGYTVR